MEQNISQAPNTFSHNDVYLQFNVACCKLGFKNEEWPGVIQSNKSVYNVVLLYYTLQSRYYKYLLSCRHFECYAYLMKKAKIQIERSQHEINNILRRNFERGRGSRS